MFEADDVVNLKRKEGFFFGNTAVFAAMLRPFGDEPSQLFWNVAAGSCGEALTRPGFGKAHDMLDHEKLLHFARFRF